MTRLAADMPTGDIGLIARPEDRQIELAAMAAVTERRNRPRHLIAFGVLLLAAALISLLLSMSARAKGGTALAGARSQATEFVELAGRLKGVSSASERQKIKPGEPVEQLLSRVQSAGARAGMTNPVPLPQQQRSAKRGPGMPVRVTLIVNNVSDPSLEAMLKWVDLCVAEIPGLQVNALEVRPERETWKLSVTFVRWEKEGA